MSIDDSMSPPARRASWGLRDMLYAGIAAIGLFIAGVGIVVGGMMAWQAVWGGLPTRPTRLQMLLLFSLEAILIIPAWRWGPGKYGGGWARLGLRRFPLVKSIIICLAGLLGILLINVLWDVVRKWLGLPDSPNYLPLFGGGWKGLLVALVIGGLVAPLAEEIFFRGYLYAGLRDLCGLGWGMCLSSLLFSLVHLVPGTLIPIFFMGFLFAFIYERTDSLWPCIALHGTVNVLAFVAAYLLERYPQLTSSL